MNEALYLGIDGGQSHTEAILADGAGNLRGRGRGGPSNHADQPGGRERLGRAIEVSVGAALRAAAGQVSETEFAAVHCAMTGDAHFKEEIIRAVLPRARLLEVGHDAPAALAGATGGGPGIVVIAGTGSVAYGETAAGARARTGGWGHLFGDEGSGFWIAAEAIRRAARAGDDLGPATALGPRALAHFAAPDLRALVAAVYYEKITRDQLAAFASEVARAAADEGDEVARAIIAEGAHALAALAAATARRLALAPAEARVACVGGVFGGQVMREHFARSLDNGLPGAQLIEPRFGPAVGALLLAYRSAGLRLTPELLGHLEQQTA